MSYEDIGTYKYYIFYCSSVPTTRSVAVGTFCTAHLENQYGNILTVPKL